MNWLQKIFKFSSNDSFFLMDGNIVFFWELHSTYLTRNFGVTMNEGNALRFVLPRGRSIYTLPGTVIEASPELEPYKGNIISELGIRPMDRPRWNFEDDHYFVSLETAQNLLSYTSYENLSVGAKRFIEKYAPSLARKDDMAA